MPVTDPERRREIQRRYREKHKDRLNAKWRERYRQNREEEIARNIAYQRSHPEVTARIQKKYLDTHPEKRQERYSKVNGRYRDWYEKLKAEAYCIKCGDTSNLVFHHRDPATKEFNLGRAVTGYFSKERLEAEVAKCDVLCTSCHRKEHVRLKRIKS